MSRTSSGTGAAVDKRAYTRIFFWGITTGGRFEPRLIRCNMTAGSSPRWKLFTNLLRTSSFTILQPLWVGSFTDGWEDSGFVADFSRRVSWGVYTDWPGS